MRSSGIQFVMEISRKKNRLGTFTSVALVMLVLGIAIYYREALGAALRRVSLAWAVAGLACFSLNYFGRAVRLTILTPRLRLWPGGIYCACLHGFMTYMLPLRSGDLSLPFILKSLRQVEIKDGLMVLYKARLLDVCALGLGIALAGILCASPLPPFYRWAMVAVGFAMAAAPLLVQLLLSVVIKPLARWQHAIEALHSLSKPRWREIGVSLLIWILIGSSLWCIAEALQIPLSISEVSLIIALQLVLQLIPVQGIANAGNHESSCLAALLFLGHPLPVALEFAIVSHVIILAYILMLGPAALITKHLATRQPA